MADGVLDQLRVDVEADGGRAAQELEKVAQAVDHLKAAVGRGVTTKIHTLTASLTELASVPSLSNVAQGMREVASAAQMMSGVKVSPTVANGITAITANVAAMPDGTATKLQALGSALQGLSGVTMRKETATNIATLATTLATTPIPDGVSYKLRDIADGVSALSAVTPPTAALGNQLRNIAAGASALATTDLPAEKVQSLVKALSHLAEIPKNGLSTTVRAMRQLPDAAKGLHDMDFDQLAEDCQRLSAALADLPDRLANVAAGMRALTKANAAANKYERMGKSSSGGLLGSLGGLVKVGSIVAGVRAVTGAIRGATEAAGGYVEDMNLFTVAMGDFGQQAWDYAQQVNQSLGINPQEWVKGQGVFMSMAQGMGVASENAALMSQQLTQLSYDLSSFYNIDVETAMEKVQAGLSGQLRPLRELGFDLSEARLKEDALAWGIDRSVDSMTQAEKALLRYRAMIEQVSFVHGDMARTVQSPMNQIRIFASAARAAAVAWGGVLLPALGAVLSILIPLARALATVGNMLASLTGGKAMMDGFLGSLGSGGGMSSAVGGMGDLADATDAAGGSAGNAAKEYEKLKRTILGFDELNVLKDATDTNSGGGGGGGGIGGGGGGMEGFELPTYDFLGDGSPYEALEKRITETLTRIGAKWEPFVKQLEDSWERIKKSFEGTDILGAVEDDLVQISEYFATCATDILRIYTNLWEDLGVPHIIEVSIELNTSQWHLATAAIHDYYEVILGLTEGLRPVTQWIGQKLVEALRWARDECEKWATWFEDMTPTFHDLGEQVGLLASNIGSVLQPVIDPLLDGLGRVLSLVGDFLRYDLKGRINGVVETLRDINGWFDEHGPAIRDAVEGFVDKVVEAKNKVVDFAKTMNTKLNKAKELIENIGGLFVALSKDMLALAQGDFSFSNVRQFLSDVEDGAKASDEAMQNVSKHVPKATTATEKAAKAGVGTVATAVNKAVSKASTKLQGAIEDSGTNAVKKSSPAIQKSATAVAKTLDPTMAKGVTNTELSAKVKQSLGIDVMNGLQTTVNTSTIPDTAGKALSTAYGKGISSMSTFVQKAGIGVAGSGAAGLGDPNTLKTGKSHGETMGTNYGTGIASKEAYAGTSAKKLGTNAVYWLDYRGTATSYGQGIGNNYSNGIGSKESLAGQKAKLLGTNAIYWLDYRKRAREIGQYVGEGFAKGMEDKNKRVDAAAGQLASTALRNLRNIPMVSSPSKVTREIGQFVGEGFALGMEDEIANVSMVAASMAQGAVDAVNRATATGALDLGGSLNAVSTMTQQVTGSLDIDYDRMADAVAYGTLQGIVQAGGQQQGQQQRELTFAIDGQTLARIVVENVGMGAADGTLDLAPIMEVM